MKEPESRILGDYEFTVRPLDPMRALRLLTRLNKALGPSLASLGAAQGGMDFPALANALAALGDRLTEDESEAIARVVLAGCTYRPVAAGGEGGELLKVLPLVLTGEPEVFLQLLGFALEVNYRALFRPLTALALKAGVKRSPSGESKASQTSGPVGG